MKRWACTSIRYVVRFSTSLLLQQRHVRPAITGSVQGRPRVSFRHVVVFDVEVLLSEQILGGIQGKAPRGLVGLICDLGLKR